MDNGNTGKPVEDGSITVKVPDKGYSKVSYVNTRGASLNYVRQGDNKESAHCSDRGE